MNGNNALIITVIIVCKNEESRIRHTINSVLEQTHNDWEMIIVDGNSEDDTLQIIENTVGCNERIRIYSENDKGVFDAMNKGIKKAYGEYIVFLNAGDYLVDESVFAKVADFLDREQPDILLTDYIYDSINKKNIVKCIYDEKFISELRYHWGICHQAVFARKNTLEEGFDLNYRFAADYNWFCRQFTKAKRIIKGDILTVNYDGYGVSSMFYNKAISDGECKDIACKYFKDAVKVWDEIDYGSEKYFNNLKMQAVRIQYNLLNDLYQMDQRKYDFSTWFRKHGYNRIAIYGMHHIGKRLYHIIMNSEIEVSFVSDKTDISDEYELYISPETEIIPETDIIIITPIVDYIKIKEFIADKRCNCSYKVMPIETLIAEFKRDFYKKNNDV